MSRKRTQEDMGRNVSSSDNSESDDSALPTVTPRTDENEINSIVSKRLSSDNVEDVSEAMKSLRTLLKLSNINGENNRKTAFRRGAHLAVVFAMRRFGIHVVLQWNGIGVLVNISCCMIGKNSTKPDIVAVGGLKSCILAMGRHLDKSSVQVVGCLLINNLWNRIDGDFRKNVVDEGGLKAVINALDNHPQNRFVQRNGCRALNALLNQESSWSQAVVDAGGIDRVITAMNNHPNNAELQEYGCTIFCLLSKAHENYRNMILQAKGLGPVGEALRVHNGNNKVKVAAQKALKAISAA